VSGTGTWMQSVALAYLVVSQTHSDVLLGVVSGAQFLPMLLAGPEAGVIVDRFPKRRVIFVTQSTFTVIASAMFMLLLAGRLDLFWIIALSLATGVVNAVDNPARQAFVQQLVGREQLQNAVSLNSANFNLARAIGPAAVGIVIAHFGLAAGFGLNAASYLAILAALVIMRPNEFYVVGKVEREKGQIREGLVYVRERPLILWTLIAVALVGVFVYNFQVTIPLLALDTFRGGAATVGTFMALFGTGAIFGGLVVASLRRAVRASYLAVISLAIMTAMLMVGWLHERWPVELALIVLGAVSISFNALANTLLQLNSSYAVRGRVMSLYTMALLGSTPIGSPLIGLIASAFGISTAFFVGALSAAVAVGIFLLLALKLNRGRPQGVTLSA
jgi:predicted MFS family arabinose efflux permease